MTNHILDEGLGIIIYIFRGDLIKVNKSLKVSIYELSF